MNPWNAVSMMVFFALCCQCMATLATIKRETNGWKWPIVAFTYMTALAYVFAVAINWLGGVVS
jgi:ferrous iron transport protein B